MINRRATVVALFVIMMLAATGCAASDGGQATPAGTGASPTSLALAHDGDGEFSVVIYNADGTSLTIHEAGQYADSVAFQSPGIITVVADGSWMITAT